MQESSKNRLKTILICLVITLPAVAIRLLNVINFNMFRGFDASAHLKYIIYLAENSSLPPVTLSLETYQPPLYYLLSSVIWNLSIPISENTAFIALKAFSTILGLFSIVISLIIIKKISKFYPNTYLVILAFMLYLPMHLYISPMIGNETLSCFLICLTLYIFIKIIMKNSFSLKESLTVGFFCGLTLLTKYTGWTIFATIVLSCLILYRKKNVSKFVMVFCVTVLIVSGWWYTRNIILYKTPFIKSNDIQKFQVFYKNQPPGKHSLKDFILLDKRIFSQPVIALNNDFDNFITKDMHFINYNEAYNSILSGTLATIWVENHGLFLKHDQITFKKAKILLLFGVFPTFLIFLGFIIGTKNLFRKRDIYFLPLMTITILSFLGYIFYNIKYPYFCHLKSFFLIHLLPTAAVSFGYGITFIKKHSRILIILIVADLFVASVLTISLYLY